VRFKADAGLLVYEASNSSVPLLQKPAVHTVTVISQLIIGLSLTINMPTDWPFCTF